MPTSEFGSAVENFLASEDQSKAAVIRNNFVATAGTSPNDFAKQVALSRATGIPVQSLLADPEEAKRHQALTGADFTGMLKQAPKTADWLLDEKNAGISRDDTDSLSLLESLGVKLDYLGKKTVSGLHLSAAMFSKLAFESASAAAGNNPPDMFAPFNPFDPFVHLPNAARFARSLSPKLDEELLAMSDTALAERYRNDPETLKDRMANARSRALLNYAYRQQTEGEKVIDQMSQGAKVYERKRYASLGEDSALISPTRWIGDALQNLPSMAALAAGSYLTRGAVLRAGIAARAAGLAPEAVRKAQTLAGARMMALIEGPSEGVVGYAQQAFGAQSDAMKISQDKLSESPEYQALIGKGWEPFAARVYLASRTGEQSGIAAGIADTAVNIAGGRVLGKVIGEGGALLRRSLKGAATEGVTETTQSALEQVFQNYAEKHNIDPSLVLSNDVLESALQGFFVGGLMGGGMSAVFGDAGREEKALEGSKAIADLMAAASKSLTLQRSPDTLHGFLQTVSPDASVFVDPEKLGAILSEAGVDVSVLPSAAQQLAESDGVNAAGIEIPVSELVTGLSGTAAEKPIIDNLRLAPDLPTVAEIKEHGDAAAAFIQAEADRVIQEQNDNEVFQQEAKTLRDDLTNELNAVGAFSPQVNQGYAKLATAFYSVLSHDLGITPLQLRDGWTDAEGNVHRGYRINPTNGQVVDRSAFDQSGKATPFFYSQLERQVTAAPDKAFSTAKSVKQWLASNAAKLGIKQDEIKWSGINEYLDAMGAEKVTKQNVLDYLAQGGVRVTEVQQGYNKPELSDAMKTALREARRDVPDSEMGWVDIADLFTLFAQRKQTEGQNDTANKYFDLAADAIRYAEGLHTQDRSAQYHAWQMPGGKNYRELLLTLPTPSELPKEYSLTQLPNGWYEIYRNYDTGARVVAAQGRTREAAIARFYGNDLGNRYTSQHWTPKDVIAHVRMNERDDAEGNRVLFIEEIQSDWAQEGRKKGFEDPEAQAKIDALREKIKGYLADRDPETNKVRDAEGYAAAMNELGKLDRARGTVPQGPFVGDTKQWVTLALRRVFRYAADNGFKKVAFINGEQSADRYDLSKQISRVVYQDNSSGGIALAKMDGEPTEGTLFAYDLNNKLVLEKRVRPDEVAEHIGKDAAEKLFKAEPESWNRAGIGVRQRTLRGLDLKVGGEGMKTFYDNIIPQLVNDLSKKMGGGKLAPIDLKGAGDEGKPIYQVWQDGALISEHMALWKAEKAAEKDRADWPDANIEVRTHVPPTIDKQLAVAVPPAASQPQPLFQTRDVTSTPEFKAWFGDSKVVDAEGNPLVMYHATYNGGFSLFDRLWSTNARRPSMDTVGIWFSTNPGEGGAGMYANGEGASVYPVYLKAEKTRYYDRFDDFLRDMHEAEGRRFEDQNPKGAGSAEGLRDKLKDQGYDSIGFIGNNVGELIAEVDELNDAINRAQREYRDEAKRLREIGSEMSAKDGQPFQAKIDRLIEKRKNVQAEIDFYGRSTEFDNQQVIVVFGPEQIKSAIGNRGTFDPNDANILHQSARQTSAATKTTFSKVGISELLNRSDWAIMTAGNPNAVPMSEEENAKRNEKLAEYLKDFSYATIPVKGMYGLPENSFAVLGISAYEAQRIGNKFGQESVLTKDGLLYADGSVTPATGLTIHQTPPTDYYSTLPDGTTFTVDLDFDTRYPSLEVAQRSSVLNQTTRAGAVSAPVTAVHFSRAPRTVLNASNFGDGLAGAERERVANASDKRLRNRIAFYVNRGSGIHPEAGVGTYAHVAVLDNLYDADADVLKLHRNNSRDLNAFESAVIDAGFSGYLQRNNFDNQGTAVLLGPRSVSVENVDAAQADALASIPPSAEVPAMKAMAVKLANDKVLPGGAMTPPEWKKAIEAAYPDMAGLMDFSSLRQNETYYKDELSRLLWHRVEGQALGSFNPATFDLALLATSDYSTFIHEVGHAFLTMYADVAAMENAPKRVTENMNALLKEMGVSDLQTWRAMSLDEQRPYHERIAEAFEQYVFTGKAPSLGLQRLFETMAAWMKRVYQSLRAFVAGHPSAKLNPELSAVFDVMLATEEEIAAAESARGYRAMFDSAAQAGMSDTDFAEYTQLNEDQRNDSESMLRTRSLGNLRWVRNYRNRFIAEMQKDTREKRAEMRKLVAAEIADRPIRQAETYLRKGVIIGESGTDIAPLGPNKLQISEVKALYPEEALTPPPNWEKLGYGKYGMLAEIGHSPDEIAERFGIESGLDLIDQLIALPKINEEIEDLTDIRMLEAYGDLSSPEVVSQAADEAIHNEVRARIVATELAALAREIGPRGVLIKAAKEYARSVINTVTPRKLKPGKYAAAEQRAGREALRALHKGERTRAAQEKRTELVNQTLAKEAYAAESEIKKIVARFQKLAAYRDDASAVKSRDFATVQAVRAILADHGIGTKGERAEEYLDTVEKNDPAAAERLRDIIDVTSQDPKNWQDISLANLRALSEAIEDIWFVAKRQHQIEVDGKLVARQAVVDELFTTLEETGKLPNRIPGEGFAPTPAEERRMTFDSFKAVLKRMDAVAYTLDGNREFGPWSRSIVGPIRDGLAAMSLRKKDVLTQFYAALKPIQKTLKRGLIPAKELTYTAADGTQQYYVFGKSANGSARAELLHAILHTGNDSNKRKLLLGRGWAELTPEGNLDTSKWDAFISRMHKEGVLTKADYDFAQNVWDLMDSMKPDAQRAHRAVFGRYFNEVTATPFSNEFGSYRGGYVPALVDSRVVSRAEDLAVVEFENESMKHAFPSPRKGFTMSRVESYARPLLLDMSSLGSHINQVLLFSHLAVPVRDAQRVLDTPKVSDALHRVYPRLKNGTITPWLTRVAKNTTSLSSPEFLGLGRFLRTARSNAGTNTMLGNLANAVQQVTGLIPASVDIEARYLRQALVRGITSPVETSRFVMAQSEYMASRLDTEADAMTQAVEEILLNPNIYESTVAWTRKHAYLLQTAVDGATSPIVWLASYNQAQDLHPELSHKDHVHIADRLVRQTQGASGPADLSTFEAGHPFFQLFTQFYGYFNTMAQFLQGRLVKTLASDMRLPKKYARAFYIVAIGFYAQAVAAELVTLAFKGGPDDDDKDGELIDDWLMQLFIYAPAKFLTSSIPFLGATVQAAANAWNDKPYDDRLSMSPAVSAVESGVRAPLDGYKAIFESGRPSKAIRSSANMIGLLTGLPTGALARPLSYLADVEGGYTQPTSIADAIRGTITGASSPESKR